MILSSRFPHSRSFPQSSYFPIYSFSFCFQHDFSSECFPQRTFLHFRMFPIILFFLSSYLWLLGEKINLLNFFADVAPVQNIFCRDSHWDERICVTLLSTTLTILLRVFPKRDSIHPVILVCAITLVNMDDIWRIIYVRVV